MPFTLRNVKDLEDIGSAFEGPPGLEFRAATKPLELEESAVGLFKSLVGLILVLVVDRFAKRIGQTGAL